MLFLCSLSTFFQSLSLPLSSFWHAIFLFCFLTPLPTFFLSLSLPRNPSIPLCSLYLAQSSGISETHKRNSLIMCVVVLLLCVCVLLDFLWLTWGRRRSSRSSWCQGRPPSCPRWAESAGWRPHTRSVMPGPPWEPCRCSGHTGWCSLGWCRIWDKKNQM